MNADVTVNIEMVDGVTVAMELDVRTVVRWHKAFSDALTTWALAERESIEVEPAERASP